MAPAYADGVDVSDKIVNRDCEQAIYGWDVTFTPSEGGGGYSWGITHHSEAAGEWKYWDYEGTQLECWNSGSKIPGPNSISQTITNLPNGTYVFGAFVMASNRQGAVANDPQDYLNIQGCYMFANGDSISVGTNAWSNNEWCHTRKFNVATQVTDGTLKIGMGMDETTNASWLGFDNAKLFYYGDASLEDALLQMRQHDVEVDIQIADTLKPYPMSLEASTELRKMCALGQKATTIEELGNAEDSIRTSCMHARNSIASFQKLVDLVNTGNEICAQEWDEAVADAVAELKAMCEETSKDLKNHIILNDDVAGIITNLNELISQVRISDVWEAIDQLATFINEPDAISEDNPCFGLTSHPGFGDANGQIPESQIALLEAIYNEADEALAKVEEGTMTAADAYAYNDKIQNAVNRCIASANKSITLPYTYITIPSEDDPNVPYRFTGSRAQIVNQTYLRNWFHQECLGNPNNTSGNIRYESPTFYLDRAYDYITIYADHTTFEIIVSENDGPEFCIGEMYIYDAEGNELLTSADQLSSYSSSISDSEKDPARMLDRNVTTFWYSRWNVQVPGYGPHEMTIGFPEPISNFRFILENYWQQYRLSSIPTQITIVGHSSAQMDLIRTIKEAENSFNYPNGNSIGCYSFDQAAFNKAIADAKAILNDSNSTEEQLYAAADKLRDWFEQLKALSFTAPEEGKAYCISCAYNPFLTSQSKVKNITLNLTDSTAAWGNADPTDPNQLFTFEPTVTESGSIAYYIKNEATGLYLGRSWVSWDEIIPLVQTKEETTPYELLQYDATLRALNLHVLGAQSYCILHPGGHNNGSGASGVIRNYKNESPSRSVWFVQEMETLPATIKLADNDINGCHHFPVGSKYFTFTADKDCAFTDFTLYDDCHRKISFTAIQTANSITVSLPSVYADFNFSFDNKEGVAQVVVDKAEKPVDDQTAYKALENAYLSALMDYQEGTEVGCIKSLSDYDKAIANAEELLENGGSDEALKSAAEAITAAVNGLELVQPTAGESYFIVSAYEPFMTNMFMEMAMCYLPTGKCPGWTYFYPEQDIYQWTFEPADTLNAWYLKNVASGLYMGYTTNAGSVNIGLTEEPQARYILVPRPNGAINIRCIEEGCDPNKTLLHPRYHNNGVAAFGVIMNYQNESPSRSEWYIRPLSYRTAIDDVIVDETQQPVVGGIFDLTGRRVAKPTKGLYIINGQKVLIK